MTCSINICRKVANISTEFETTNTALKRDYIVKNKQYSEKKLIFVEVPLVQDIRFIP